MAKPSSDDLGQMIKDIEKDIADVQRGVVTKTTGAEIARTGRPRYGTQRRIALNLVLDPVTVDGLDMLAGREEKSRGRIIDGLVAAAVEKLVVEEAEESDDEESAPLSRPKPRLVSKNSKRAKA